MISSLKRRAAQHLLNHSGWSTGRKIIVIESDDWGSVRMPSAKVYHRLLSKGVAVYKSPYCKYDSLASEEDLTLLFEVLSKYEDSLGNPPVITANTVVTNPDFDRIGASGFREYHCEWITKTFKKYPEHKNCLRLWEKGRKSGLFYPQSHGREHVNVSYWLQLLRDGEYDFRLAFENGCWGLSSDVYPEMRRSIQASLDMDYKEDIEHQKELIRNGLHLFEEIFGYRSKSFIANNFIWSPELNRVLSEEGVRYLQGMKYQKLPLLNGKRRKMVRRYLGEKNEFNQYHLIRNCTFEPSLQKPEFNSLTDCLKAIETAFYWNKPAIISSHRLNYVGFIDPENRNRNLKLLNLLLEKITNRWKEVEFMRSDQLGELIEKNDQ